MGFSREGLWRCASHAAGQETAPRLTRTGPLAATAVGAATIIGAVVMAVASDLPAVSVVRVIMMLAAIVGLGDRDSFLAYRRSHRRLLPGGDLRVLIEVSEQNRASSVMLSACRPKTPRL